MNKDNTRDKLSNEMKATIAEWIREDNISFTNSNSKQVVFCETFYTKYVKRLIDIVVSLIVLIITLPLNLVIGVITLFDVGKPLFFKQNRVGKDAEIFEIIKFRNMKNTVDENGILLPADQRVTKWGRFVRKLSLDELLNFVSVLKGDMSIIGPRPLPESYLPRYSDRHKQRHRVRPGLECPPHDIKNFDGSWEQRLENEIWYIEHISFLTDCFMIIRLFQFAITPKFANKRGNAKTLSFIGYNNNGKAIDLNEVPEEYIMRVLEMSGINVYG